MNKDWKRESQLASHLWHNIIEKQGWHGQPATSTGQNAEWANVQFTDESSFSVSIDDIRLPAIVGNTRIHGSIHESEPKLNRGYGSVNVLGGIIGGRRLPLLCLDSRLAGETYINNVLIPHILPFFITNESRLNNTIILQQDNTPPQPLLIKQTSSKHLWKTMTFRCYLGQPYPLISIALKIFGPS